MGEKWRAEHCITLCVVSTAKTVKDSINMHENRRESVNERTNSRQTEREKIISKQKLVDNSKL